MHHSRASWLTLTALAALIWSAASGAAAEPASADPADNIVLPKPAEVQALAVSPTAITLKGQDDAQQLILTATLVGNRPFDLTTDAKYESADPKIVRVTSGGRVIPVSTGKTAVTATFGDKSVTVPISTEAVDENLPINFANQIVPIFTKLGCNGGGCHGKAAGQNGFKISLLGYEPDVDFNALVKEARGRRIFPAAPDSSLLLLKGTGILAHAGGKRMEPGSDEYRLVRRWIAAGTPYGQPTDPVVTKISIFPEQRILAKNSKQQFAVYAHYNNGLVEDITRRALYDSNEGEIAIVDAGGLVRTLGMSGEAAIMARYQGFVTVFRATVPSGSQVPEYKFEAKTVVDQFTLKKWQQLGLAPSDLCTDEEFIRRASLDVTGTLPTPTQIKAFLTDADPAKRDKLIDRLVETPEYTYYFANKWADILRVKRRNQADRAQGTFGFHQWIREAIAADKPHDQFAREILTATGDMVTTPTAAWYTELEKPEQFVDDTAQVFLGQRIACAQCHHHPYEKWSQDDYWGMAAFFARVGRKPIAKAGQTQPGQQPRQFIFTRSNGTVPNKRTGQAAVMKALDGDPVVCGTDEDPRQKLVDWMVDAKNPFFAKAVANRYWAHFFGRGIVDPLDDMRMTNPPSNPELLDALAQDLTNNKYSLKSLIKTICKSRTYQLSSNPNELNKNDKQNFARHYPRRLGAEVLFDAVCQVTGSPTAFGGLPQDAHAPKRAIMLPDESFSSYFLDVFGRPQRISACECERSSEANLAQALQMLNSDEVQGKIARQGGRAHDLAKDTRSDAEKVEELWLWTFGRKPTQEDLNHALAHIEKMKTKNSTQLGYENIVWALLNSKEFAFNR